MGDINQSASASAEANGVKFSGNTVNLSLSAGSGTDKPGALSKIIRAINPVYYEQREAKAREIKAESILATAKRFHDEFPAMSERRALFEAMGYRITNDQADNVAEVFEEANDRIESQGKTAKGLPPESLDAILEGSKTAYDDTIRSMWAKLVAGESLEPGTFSKRTMSVLSDMSSADAKAFGRLCSMCVFKANGLTIESEALVILQEDESKTSFNGEAFTYSDRSSLESFGLIDSTLSCFFEVRPGGKDSVIAGSEIIVLENRSKSTIEFTTSPVFTKTGVQLSRLCEIGIGEGLSYYLTQMASKKGLVAYSMRKKAKVDFML